MTRPSGFKSAEHKFMAGQPIREIKRIVIDLLPTIL
jgi:hypothetical protein